MLIIFGGVLRTQLIFTCSKSTIETLEKGVKYVQSSIRNTWKRCEICSDLTIETLEKRARYVQS